MVSVAKIMRRPWIVGTGQVHWLLLWKFKRFYSKLREERNTRSPDSPWPRWATLHCTALPDSRGAQINRISIVESTIQDTSGLTTTTNQPHALLLIFKIRELLDLIDTAQTNKSGQYIAQFKVCVPFVLRMRAICQSVSPSVTFQNFKIQIITSCITIK